MPHVQRAFFFGGIRMKNSPIVEHSEPIKPQAILQVMRTNKSCERRKSVCCLVNFGAFVSSGYKQGGSGHSWRVVLKERERRKSIHPNRKKSRNGFSSNVYGHPLPNNPGPPRPINIPPSPCFIPRINHRIPPLFCLHLSLLLGKKGPPGQNILFLRFSRERERRRGPDSTFSQRVKCCLVSIAQKRLQRNKL